MILEPEVTWDGEYWWLSSPDAPDQESMELSVEEVEQLAALAAAVIALCPEQNCCD